MRRRKRIFVDRKSQGVVLRPWGPAAGIFDPC